mgnify:FL=1
MDLSKIISVAGKSGLFRIIAQGRQAIIAESLLDGKRVPVHASLRISSLDEISMYTTGDDVPLAQVLEKLYEVEKGGPSLDPKEREDKLFAKLAEALPEHDRERIYPSDVRKLFSWYGQLLKAGEFDKKDEKKEKEAKAEEEVPKAAKAAAKEEAPKKKAAAKKGAPAKTAGGSTKAKATTTVRRSAQRGA